MYKHRNAFKYLLYVHKRAYTQYDDEKHTTFNKIKQLVIFFFIRETRVNN